MNSTSSVGATIRTGSRSSPSSRAARSRSRPSSTTSAPVISSGTSTPRLAMSSRKAAYASLSNWGSSRPARVRAGRRWRAARTSESWCGCRGRSCGRPAIRRGPSARCSRPGAGTDHVGDRVQRADLVEVHVLGRRAVHGGLGLGQPGEVASARVRTPASSPPAPAGTDVAPGAVRAPSRRRVTSTRVAANPLRVTSVTSSADRLRRHRVDRGPDRRRAARRRRRGRRGTCRRWRRTRRRASRAVTGPLRSCGAAALRATRAAKTPAPYPLSMLTTVTPGAHEFSIASRAARPPNEAP